MRALMLGTLILALAVFPTFDARADATHQASVCGRLLEYVPAPSDSLAHGYAHVRIATASGDTSVLFHHINPGNAPSRIHPGATRQGASVCISGPYVHVVGSSPYVSPYDLRLASLPSTSTAADAGGFTVCGTLNHFNRSRDSIGIGGVTYRLVGAGTVSDGLGTIGTALNPEVVRLTGRIADALTNSVADYSLVRVPACALPSTSTLTTID